MSPARLFVRPASLFLALVLTAPAATAQPKAVTGDLAFVGVNVVDVATGRVLPDQTVVVRGERITEVLPATACRVTGDTKVIDGAGRYLIPGLWDMHVHLVDDAMPEMFLRHGVTGVRHMFSIRPFYQYTRPPGQHATVLPRMVMANQVLDGPGTPFRWPVRKNVLIAKDAGTAEDAVAKLQKDGNDFVKVYSALPRDAYFVAVKETRARGLAVAGHIPHLVSVGEASDAGHHTVEHLGGVAFACSELENDLRKRLARIVAPPAGGKGADSLPVATAWQDQIEAHGTRDEKKEAALFAKFVKNGTWHVPTLAVAQALGRLSDPIAMPPGIEERLPGFVRTAWKREWKADGTVTLTLLGLSQTPTETRLRQHLFRLDSELVGRMHKAGVRLLVGTDTPAPLVMPGESLHDELALFVGAGLTPAEALRTATLNPAVCLGREKDLGTVEKGKLADLVLLARNPLEDIRNTTSVVTVVVGGRVVPR